MGKTVNIEVAREAAAAYFKERGYDREAEIVRSGDGDEFPEVRLALHLLPRRDRRVQSYESALRFYADPDFWDDDVAGGALMMTDKGKTAQHALAGKELPIEQGEGP